jgi:hypothetical protein
VDERSRQRANCGTELTSAQLDELACLGFSSYQSVSEVKSRFGCKAQVGGGIAILFGVTLLAVDGHVNANLDVLYRLPTAFILIGASLVLMGTVARWFYLN